MNMKPPEILSMIEEATGTSMYESKKESAQRMIEKKENKLTQINRVIRSLLTFPRCLFFVSTFTVCRFVCFYSSRFDIVFHD